ncbi:MAG: diaminopimelate decarboxylase [Firmicutes bacterium]|nr:diaminopimelate decarboxylase [Bacillota bacterium]
MNWLNDKKIFELAEEFGTPLYVYDESILRKSCKDMLGLLPGKNFHVSYSVKANSNIELLKIIKEEKISADAMSPGEIHVLLKAGFKSSEIFFIPNNVSEEEMRYALDRNILISADSLSQLDLIGRINAGGEVALRFNPSAGLGHHEKVVTAGKNTKFGIQTSYINEVKNLLKKYNLKLKGINQHLGSLVLEKEPYLEGAKELLNIAKQFPGLSFIDFGGGFGVPYRENEKRLSLKDLSEGLDKLVTGFLKEYDNKNVMFKIEPGRYITAECGILLGTVNTLKTNYDTEYVGTDIGFNVLLRPALYDSYHAIHIAKKKTGKGLKETYTIVGNICETGDIIAKDRELEKIDEGDIIAVLTAGAYGYSMSSNYNCRLRPAEVLINADGTHRLIRKRETFEDLLRNFV